MRIIAGSRKGSKIFAPKGEKELYKAITLATNRLA